MTLKTRLSDPARHGGSRGVQGGGGVGSERERDKERETKRERGREERSDTSRGWGVRVLW